jgi:hypothetical protein
MFLRAVPAIVLESNQDGEADEKSQGRPTLRLDLHGSLGQSEEPASAQSLLSPINSPTWAEIGRRSLDGTSSELDSLRRTSMSSQGSARETAAGLIGASLAPPASPSSLQPPPGHGQSVL